MAGLQPPLPNQPTDTSAHAWSRFVNQLMSVGTRGLSQRIQEAFLAESWCIEELEQHAGPEVRIVRTWEAAPVDGVMIWAPDYHTVPPQGASHLELLDWLSDNPEAKFLSFDVKTVYFRPLNFNQHVRGGLYDMAYKWTDNHGRGIESASLIFVVFEGVHDYIGVVPTPVYEAASDHGYGIEPLVNKTPGWSHGAMVSLSALGTAIDGLFRAARRDGPYTSPTTMVEFKDWIPPFQTNVGNKLLVPQNRALLGAMNGVYDVRRAVESVSSHRVRMNPMQPCIADFLLELATGPGPLFVELKTWTGVQQAIDFAELSGVDRSVPARSPFARGRQWHILLLKSKNNGYLCIPRHRVTDQWSHHPHLGWKELQEFHYPEADISRMLKDIEKNALQAIRAARLALHDLVGASDLALISTSSLDHALKRKRFLEDQFVREETVVGTQRGSQKYLRGLPWLSIDLNREACEQGYGLCFSLPNGHVMGTHVLVGYHWTEHDRLEFKSSGTLPRLIFSEDLMEQDVIILRFIDVRGHATTSPYPAWPVHIAPSSWLRPGPEQHFIFVGSMFSSEVMERFGAEMPYWCFPSEHLNCFDQGLREENSDKLAEYFRRVPIEEDVLPHPPLIMKTRPSPLAPQSGFLTEEAKATVNPGRYIVNDVADLYANLRGILRGTTHSISTSQSSSWNHELEPARYTLKMREVMAASWDWGLTRKIPTIEGKGNRRGKGKGKGEGDEGNDQGEEYDSNEGANGGEDEPYEG